MRNISFMLTTHQFMAGEKDVTRRLGWGFARVGDIYMGVKKSQGIKKGEHIEKLHAIKVVKAGWCPLRSITDDDCRREGFPDLRPKDFVEMFIEHNKNKCHEGEYTPVMRIEFEHVWHVFERLLVYWTCASCGKQGFAETKDISFAGFVRACRTKIDCCGNPDLGEFETAEKRIARINGR